MRIPSILGLLLLSATSAMATVSLQFSTTSVYATNFANSAGAGGTTLAWGVLIDTAGDGFDKEYRPTGISYANSSTVQTLLYQDGSQSDDVLFMSSNLMNLISAAQSVNDGSATGQNRITNANNLPLGASGVAAGQSFAVIWFNTTALTGGPSGANKWYGILENADFVLPAEGSTVNFAAAAFTGADPLKAMTYPTPEPSAVLLGLLGAVSLLRRRR